MALADAGTNYGTADDELAAVFDEMFEECPGIEAIDFSTYFFCFSTYKCR